MATKKQPPVKTILDQLYEAQAAEEAARKKRIKLEIEVFEAVKADLRKKTGQESIEILGFGITVNRPITWGLDEAEYRALCKTLPEHLQCHRTKLDLDKKKFDGIMSLADSPEIHPWIKKIQDVVMATPGKIAVKIIKIA
jgi:hypothetical protein